MIVILMGVTGVGKTTVGKLLAEARAATFYDADDYHPPANVAKMRAGIPLDDADRWPWLDRLNQLLRSAHARGEQVVLACSALKEAYRQRLARDCEDVHFVWLRGERELIQARLAARKGHYMNPALLDSQFATLELPAAAIAVDVSAAPPDIVREICRALAQAV